jgi:hypothetical protein
MYLKNKQQGEESSGRNKHSNNVTITNRSITDLLFL